MTFSTGRVVGRGYHAEFWSINKGPPPLYQVGGSSASAGPVADTQPSRAERRAGRVQRFQAQLADGTLPNRVPWPQLTGRGCALCGHNEAPALCVSHMCRTCCWAEGTGDTCSEHRRSKKAR